MNKQKAFYLNFSGWIDLDVDTNMQYIGTKEDPHCITVAEWSQLSSSKKEEYTMCHHLKTYMLKNLNSKIRIIFLKLLDNSVR